MRANRYCVISQGQQPGIRFPPPDYTPSAGEKGRLSANVESAYPRFGNTLETFLSRGLGRLSANLKSASHRSEISERPFFSERKETARSVTVEVFPYPTLGTCSSPSIYGIRLQGFESVVS